jgi:glutamate synthase (NADPH/NADH) small chain
VSDKVRMREQSPEERIKNFNEVPYGYDEREALQEASRCLGCKKHPCTRGCPVEVNIPEFIARIKESDFIGAVEVIKRKNSLPAICGRVCPQENQCESYCVLGRKGEPVAIGRLERFAADYEREHRQTGMTAAPSSGSKTKVAVIGAGPAGLTAAADLALLGYEVVLFEALHAPGGVLRYGIPEFRLPKAILDEEVGYIRSLGVDIRYNMLVGATLSIDDLFADGYKAVFIGTGAGLPYFLGIPGENLNGVYSANEFLTRVNLMRAYRFPEYDTPVRIGRHVAVVGGGNVAMDAARTALRLGADKVSIVYRRAWEEMPARAEEKHHGREEGIDFKLLNNPVAILGDEKGWVKGMECVRMELGEPDESGRRRPVVIEGSEYVLDVDTVVVSIGQGPNPLLVQSTSGLETNKRGNITADPDTMATSIPGVYAGGDIVTGAATVIAAMGAGKIAAGNIDKYLKIKGL